MVILCCFFALFFFLVTIYMVYVLRYKCDVVIITDREIELRKMFAAGKRFKISLKEIELFPSWEHVRIGTGAKTLIYHKSKRISELSDLSYSNYHDLIWELEPRTTFKPFIDDSYVKRFKHAFL